MCKYMCILCDQVGFENNRNFISDTFMREDILDHLSKHDIHPKTEIELLKSIYNYFVISLCAEELKTFRYRSSCIDPQDKRIRKLINEK